MGIDVFILLVAGLAGGFVGGLVGVGGGLIFAPVLFFYFQAIGVSPEILTPLTIGTSLFCTLIVALSSTRTQFQKRAVSVSLAGKVGSASAVAVVLMTVFVTTQSWYDSTAFQMVFGILLLIVAIQMSLPVPSGASKKAESGAANVNVPGKETGKGSTTPTRAIMAGSAAGVVASAAGVGGGILLVPVYHRLFRMPIHRAVGTSSATIVLISFAGVLSYAFSDWDLRVSAISLGYVDVARALILSVPAAITARVGARTAHRINTVKLRRSFAVVAILVSLRLLMRSFGLG